MQIKRLLSVNFSNLCGLIGLKIRIFAKFSAHLVDLVVFRFPTGNERFFRWKIIKSHFSQSCVCFSKRKLNLSVNIINYSVVSRPIFLFIDFFCTNLTEMTYRWKKNSDWFPVCVYLKCLSWQLFKNRNSRRFCQDFLSKSGWIESGSCYCKTHIKINLCFSYFKWKHTCLHSLLELFIFQFKCILLHNRYGFSCWHTICHFI